MNGRTVGTIFFLLTMITLVCAQSQSYGPNIDQEIGVPKFKLEPEMLFSEQSNRSRVLITLRIPYGSFQYVKRDSSYLASFEITAELKCLDKKRRKEPGTVRFWLDSLVLPTFKKTVSRTEYYYFKNSIDVDPGTYKLKVRLTDIDTRLSWEETSDLTLFNRSGDSLSVTAPILVKWLDRVDQPTDFIPANTALFYPGKDTAWIYVQMIPVGSGTLKIHERIVKDQGDAALDTIRYLEPDRRAYAISFPVPINTLGSGTYQHTFIFEQAGQRIARVIKYRIGILGIPSQIVDFEKAIKQLKYVLPEEDVDKMLKLSPVNREKALRKFWDARDPTPTGTINDKMQEYYRRVDIANQRFTRSREGWETDRGMVLVLFGEPNEIDAHPFVTQGKPYEKWFYSNSNQHFTFVDYDGFGDYRLITPLWD